MEYVKCVLCNSSNLFKERYQIHDRFNPDKKYKLQECQCGMIMTNPRPDLNEIASHYNNDNYHPNKRKNKIFNILYKLAQSVNNKSKKKIIMHHIKSNGSILDYGGGDGQFRDYMYQKSWEANIYEPYLDGGMKKSKEIKMIKHNYYDVISMFHSLEHVYDIDECLKSISDYLKDKGILVISIPNHDAYERKFFNDNWIAYDVPRHLYHFTFESVERILNKNKFKIIDYKPIYIDTFYNVLMSSNSRVNFLKIPYLILISLLNVYINSKLASSIMVVCQKYD